MSAPCTVGFRDVFHAIVLVDLPFYTVGDLNDMQFSTITPRFFAQLFNDLNKQGVIALDIEPLGEVRLVELIVITGLCSLCSELFILLYSCLLYTSPSPRDRQKSRMPSSA